MKIKFKKKKPTLPAHLTVDAVADYIGCSRRTVNRWLKDMPKFGITAYSASGKHQRVLTKDEAVWLFDQMVSLHTKGGKQ